MSDVLQPPSHPMTNGERVMLALQELVMHMNSRFDAIELRLDAIEQRRATLEEVVDVPTMDFIVNAMVGAKETITALRARLAELEEEPT